MSVFRTLAAAVSLAALAACQQGIPAAMPWQTPAVPPAEESLATQCAGDPAIAAQLDGAVNAAREVEGKTLLDSAPDLTQIAQSHACDMALLGRVDVEGSNGSSVVDRARAVGYPTCGVVQLVWRGGSPADAVANWLAREAQRTEMLGQSSRQVGSGHAVGADGMAYYSVVLGDNCR
ncbi:CAP domain-containing protein [Paracoccus benzoatiresistens]|uniref:CAP domain-containing protein n=1 Tax=Paracoccus benzoatiresistens TaxID=2997341 RepID=A0ABT4J9C0_9RHOB|nr:CAP domain-containing protein [Paracoccus sp. EF6]MCZ0963290.1 CAP domain-containing protein [Paracoccus sp. EF6]